MGALEEEISSNRRDIKLQWYGLPSNRDGCILHEYSPGGEDLQCISKQGAVATLIDKKFGYIREKATISNGTLIIQESTNNMKPFVYKRSN